MFDKALLASLAQGLGDPAQQRYNKGQVIMVAGQTGALMYVVLEGKVSISIRGAVVQFVGPGAVFGEMALIDQSPRTATATAKTECKLAVIPEKRFLFMVQTTPHFALQIMKVMADRQRRMNERV